MHEFTSIWDTIRYYKGPEDFVTPTPTRKVFIWIQIGTLRRLAFFKSYTILEDQTLVLFVNFHNGLKSKKAFFKPAFPDYESVKHYIVHSNGVFLKGDFTLYNGYD